MTDPLLTQPADVKRLACPSTSPIRKFDEGPRHCRGEKGHKGPHHARTSDGHYVDPRYDYPTYWNDEGEWVRV